MVADMPQCGISSLTPPCFFAIIAACFLRNYLLLPACLIRQWVQGGCDRSFAAEEGAGQRRRLCPGKPAVMCPLFFFVLSKKPKLQSRTDYTLHCGNTVNKKTTINRSGITVRHSQP